MARTFGTEILEQLQDGRLAQLPSSYLHGVREKICAALEELLDIGARIRPLTVGGQRVGWVRGVHLTERQTLKRWVHDDIEVVEHILRLGTSLSAGDIQNLTMLEMRSLARLVRDMTDSDMKLYPYLPAFTSTSASEQLWYSRLESGGRIGEREDLRLSTILSASKKKLHYIGRNSKDEYYLLSELGTTEPATGTEMTVSYRH